MVCILHRMQILRLLEPVMSDSQIDAIDMSEHPAMAAAFELALLAHEMETLVEGLSNSKSAASANADQRLELTPVGCISVDDSHIISDANLAAAQLLGATKDVLVGRSIFDFVQKSDRCRFRTHLTRLFKGRYDAVEVVLRGLSKSPLTAISRGVPLADSDGGVRHSQLTIENVSAYRAREDRLREDNDHLEHIAHHDSLTALPNRLLFEDRLAHALVRARRSGSQLALLFLDLDGFKAINDTLGHATGDALLCEVAKRIRACVREEDTVARLGGDEFTVVLEHMQSAAVAGRVARKILRAVKAPIELNHQRVNVGVSVGIAMYPNDAETAQDLQRYADAAMYRAKVQDTQSIAYVTAELNARLSRRATLEQDVSQALSVDQLSIAFEPQVALGDGNIRALQAQLVWRHEKFGRIPQAELDEVCDTVGKGAALHEWMLARACEQLSLWRNRGAQVSIAISLPRHQLGRSDLCRTMQERISAHALAPCALEVEVSESSLGRSSSTARSNVNALAGLGVPVTLDGFATQANTFALLRDLPLARLKLDESRTSRIHKDAKDRIIAKSLIRLARDLGLAVGARALTAREQVDLLHEQGCDRAQGAILGKAMSARKVTPRLASAAAIESVCH